jgi:hypothetical protein
MSRGVGSNPQAYSHVRLLKSPPPPPTRPTPAPQTMEKKDEKLVAAYKEAGFTSATPIVSAWPTARVLCALRPAAPRGASADLAG